MADELLFKKNALKKNDSVRSDTSRKLRWSSCLSFVSNKFKRSSKSGFVQNYEDLHASFKGQSIDAQAKTHVEQVEEPLLIELKKAPVDPVSSTNSNQWKQPISALSPPPRHSKARRESVQVAAQPVTLIDTTRVNPRPNKGQQPALLRLSLDAECLQSPTQSLKEEDVESISTGNSFDSIRPTPIRSGTLGGTKRTSDPMIPPLPQSWFTSTHGSSSSILETIHSTEDDEENKRLSLKERRQRKSPLLSPNTEQLVLAINETRIVEDNDILHGQLSLETNNFAAEDQSREEAMMALEGKKTVATRPIVNTQELDKHFNQKDKIMTKHQSLTMNNYQKKPFENRMPRTVSRIPETPPHHQQFAPSLISVPSTPNSMDSSLMDHDDCITQHNF